MKGERIWWAVNFVLNKNPSTLKGGPKLALARVRCVAQVTPAEVHHIYWIVRPPKEKALCVWQEEPVLKF